VMNALAGLAIVAKNSLCFNLLKKLGAHVMDVKSGSVNWKGIGTLSTSDIDHIGIETSVGN